MIDSGTNTDTLGSFDNVTTIDEIQKKEKKKPEKGNDGIAGFTRRAHKMIHNKFRANVRQFIYFGKFFRFAINESF